MYRNLAIFLAVTLGYGWVGQVQAEVAVEPDAVFETLLVGKSQIELQFSPALTAAKRRNVRDWMERSAGVVAGYFGEFPVPAVTMLVIASDGDGVKSGTTFSDPELRIRVKIGIDTTPAMFLDDWILVHEMVHLAIPQVPRHQNWFHEGAATYIEIVSRANAGLSGADGGWAELIRNMDKGRPKAGDRGLDHTPTWGRTYWGGAIFCLLADVELRKLSQNRLGLQDAMRAIVTGGGSYGVAWSLERTLRTADQATGFDVLTRLHQRMKDSAAEPPLTALWAELGVMEDGAEVVLRDEAPLAKIRDAIIGRRAAKEIGSK